MLLSVQGILQGIRCKGAAKQLGVPGTGCPGEFPAHSEVPPPTVPLTFITVYPKQACVERGGVDPMPSKALGHTPPLSGEFVGSYLSRVHPPFQRAQGWN